MDINWRDFFKKLGIKVGLSALKTTAEVIYTELNEAMGTVAEEVKEEVKEEVVEKDF